MFEFKKPRSLAFASLRPRETVKITVDPPIRPEENFRVFSLSTQVKGAIAIDVPNAGEILVRNTSDVEVPYLFVVLPAAYLRFIEADWDSLRLFLKSLQKHVPGWIPAMPAKPVEAD